ncbi:PREDICTED: lecithin retinol acyltransferase-like [Priapulus caudatus]|uniref:Lecithin retinol acyltransferase-like n=1 Tax=Priapulus caudatus TaxID=37621 RepID=A0ABM1EZF2_PRICU|nr:PREDICTED: lecithin retinol acyltransferase-like [Priapulus caudatus]
MPLFHDISKGELKRGDHIYVWRTGYHHHGIWDGRKVIHFSGAKSGDKSNATIRRDALDVFLDGGNLKIYLYGMSMWDIWYEIAGTSTTLESDSPDTVMDRAESRIGDADYYLFGNNCEHFALWCKLGERAKKVQTQTTPAN